MNHRALRAAGITLIIVALIALMLGVAASTSSHPIAPSLTVHPTTVKASL